jgi:hypothetical protein
VTAPDDTEAALALGRSFIAMQYLLGRRNEELVSPVGLSASALASCDALLRQLCTADRNARARALAAEIAVLVRALQQREIA